MTSKNRLTVSGRTGKEEPAGATTEGVLRPRLIPPIPCLALALAAWVGASPAAVLVNKGLSPYTVVVASNASPSEKHAAEELVRFFKEMSGATLPVVDESQGRTGPEIVLGLCGRPVCKGISIDDVGPDGFVLKEVGDDLVMAGSRVRGTLYGVYELLDRLGCRFFTATVSRIPTLKTIDTGKLDLRVKPRFSYRFPYWAEADDPDWSARNRANGSSKLTAKHGGKLEWHLNHSFAYFFPPDACFKDHPEWYSEIDGKRVGSFSQLCLTNEELKQAMIQKVLDYFRAHPEAEIVSVGANDGGAICQCAPCKAAYAKENGAYMGALLPFVNAVGDAVAKEFPEKYVSTLGYGPSYQPPKTVKAAKNVIIYVCSPNMGHCFHPLRTCPRYAGFVKDMTAWNATAPGNIFIWNYCTAYACYLLPYPTTYYIADDIRFFRDNGVSGIMEQGAYSVGAKAENSELKAYLQARLLWNPDADENAIIADFLQGVYGKAADPMKAYLDLICAPYQGNCDFHVAANATFTYPHLSDETVTKAEALFGQMRELVKDDPAVLLRVEQASLPMELMVLLKKGQGTMVWEGDRYKLKDAAQIEGRLEHFSRIVQACQIEKYAERQSMPAWLTEMNKYVHGMEILKLVKDDLAVGVIPSLGGRIQYFGTPDQKTNFLMDARAGGVVSGGYEEYTFNSYHGPGWSEEYKVVSRDERSIVLACDLPQHLSRLPVNLTRSIELLPGRKMKMASVLTNIGKKPTEGLIRTHPIFTLAPQDQMWLWMVREGGVFVGPLTNVSQSCYFKGKDAPLGKWAILAPETGRGIRMDFDPAQLAFPYLWREGTTVNLELYSKSVMIQTNESIRLDTTWILLDATEVAGLMKKTEEVAPAR